MFALVLLLLVVVCVIVCLLDVFNSVARYFLFFDFVFCVYLWCLRFLFDY